MESEFTAQLPVEGARCLKKWAILGQEGQLRCQRIWGATLRIYGEVVGPRSSTSCVQNPTLDPRVRLKKTISTQPADSFRCAEYVVAFFLLSCAACGTLNRFPTISNFDEFRYIQVNSEIFRLTFNNRKDKKI